MGGPCTVDGHERAEMDNFYSCQMTIDGKTWPSSEHYFQACKFPGNYDHQEHIRLALSGMDAWHLGNEKPSSGSAHRTDWEEIKVDMMYRANLEKYSQIKFLGQILTRSEGPIVATGGLFWKTWNEVLLERIREELRGDSGNEQVLAQRTAAMDAYRHAASQKNHRRIEMITACASKRMPLPQETSVPSIEIDFSPAVKSIDRVFKVDPLAPQVNGQPHYMNKDGKHLYLGTKYPSRNWVMDDYMCPGEACGEAFTPTVGGDEFPLGLQNWNVWDDSLNKHVSALLESSSLS